MSHEERSAIEAAERERCAVVAENCRQEYEMTTQLVGNVYNVACLDVASKIRSSK